MGVFAFFNPHHPDTGGETYFWLVNHVFLRPVDFASDRLIGPSGVPVAPPPDFDVEDARAKLSAGDPSMDPARSGLYRRWQLDVHDALERGLSVEQLLTP